MRKHRQKAKRRNRVLIKTRGNMKKTILIICLFLSFAHAQNDWTKQDFWKQEDKQKHFFGTFAISATSTAIMRHKGYNEFEAFLGGAMTGIAVGWIKEQFDKTGRGTYDSADMDANFLGSISGALATFKFECQFEGLK